MAVNAAALFFSEIHPPCNTDDDLGPCPETLPANDLQAGPESRITQSRERRLLDSSTPLSLRSHSHRNCQLAVRPSCSPECINLSRANRLPFHENQSHLPVFPARIRCLRRLGT